ncbi:unnamed protein product [Dovyalis caffra]|uniref:Thioredoxin domain-containing protein n=1 Tax=Dovyalis caffra TaxID=77055 RepID=A0AAV1RM80_9ROSI|nr:unnamed protein product [Dovyalis caffra]
MALLQTHSLHVGTLPSTFKSHSSLPFFHFLVLLSKPIKKVLSFLPLAQPRTDLFRSLRNKEDCFADPLKESTLDKTILWMLLNCKKLSAEEIQELVKGERQVPLIIDFYATWCGPCVMMAQELEMLAVEYESNVMIVKVDTDDEYEFAQDMQVRGLPTLFFISPDPNKDALRTEGLVPIQMMRDIINNEM